MTLLMVRSVVVNVLKYLDAVPSVQRGESQFRGMIG